MLSSATFDNPLVRLWGILDGKNIFSFLWVWWEIVLINLFFQFSGITRLLKRLTLVIYIYLPDLASDRNTSLSRRQTRNTPFAPPNIKSGTINCHNFSLNMSEPLKGIPSDAIGFFTDASSNPAGYLTLICPS